jgi:hypothetical protein
MPGKDAYTLNNDDDKHNSNADDSRDGCDKHTNKNNNASNEHEPETDKKNEEQLSLVQNVV